MTLVPFRGQGFFVIFERMMIMVERRPLNELVVYRWRGEIILRIINGIKTEKYKTAFERSSKNVKS